MIQKRVSLGAQAGGSLSGVICLLAALVHPCAGEDAPTSIAPSGRDVAALEADAMAGIDSGGVGDRYTIPGIPFRTDSLCAFIYSGTDLLQSFSISDVDPFASSDTLLPVSVTLLTIDEFQSRFMPKQDSLTAMMFRSIRRVPMMLKRFPGDRILAATNSWGQQVPLPPLGQRSIHRMLGRLALGGVTFISEGDESEALTFVVLRPYGYVYLRGRGRVVEKDGTEVRLGYR